MRRRYRKWNEQGVSIEKWRGLLQRMAETLPDYLVSIKRLEPERGIDELDKETLKLKLRDVDSGDWRYWFPLVVEGSRHVGKVLVSDGNHRAHALLMRETKGTVHCVFAEYKRREEL